MSVVLSRNTVERIEMLLRAGDGLRGQRVAMADALHDMRTGRARQMPTIDAETPSAETLIAKYGVPDGQD